MQSILVESDSLSSVILLTNLFAFSCLQEKLGNVDIRPDSDKIGPLYDVRQDNIIGHLIVLLQYNWPKGEALFEQLVKTVTTLGGLRYERFFSYVTSILSSVIHILYLTSLNEKITDFWLAYLHAENNWKSQRSHIQIRIKESVIFCNSQKWLRYIHAVVLQRFYNPGQNS